MVYNFFDKTWPSGCVKSENKLNQKLAKELLKPFIRKFQKRKIHSSFIENIWDADQANTQLISKFNKEFILYYMLLVFSVNIMDFPFKRQKRYYNS